MILCTLAFNGRDLAHDTLKFLFFFFFNDTATTEIYTVMNTLSLHDALPICSDQPLFITATGCCGRAEWNRSEEHTSELQSLITISYAVFCLKKKKRANEVQSARLGVDCDADWRTAGLCPGGRLNPCGCFFFFNDTATTEIYTVMNTLSLHDALPISPACAPPRRTRGCGRRARRC